MHLIMAAKGEISPTGSKREAAIESIFLSVSCCPLYRRFGFAKIQLSVFGSHVWPKILYVLISALFSSRFSNVVGLLLRNFVKLNPSVCKTILISFALPRASSSDRSAWIQPCRTALFMCTPLDAPFCGHLQTSAVPKLHKNVNMWLQKWVDCVWRSSHCHPLCTENVDCPGLMVGCQSASTFPWCSLWLLLSTVWSREEGHPGCKVDPAVSAMHNWVWDSLFNVKQRVWLCGFCFACVCWSLGEEKGTKQECLQLGSAVLI